MKKLYLLRHGKSSWDSPNISDFQRPLLPKGVERTQKMASYCRRQEIIFERIYASDSNRTMQTAAIFAQVFHLEIEAVSSLYQANVAQLDDLIFQQDNHLQSILLIGHNPSLTNFLQQFVSVDWMKTSSLGVLHFDTDSWQNIYDSSLVFSSVIFPKQIHER